MRKRKRYSNILKPNVFDGALKTKYEFKVVGLNQDLLINRLYKDGISLFDLRKENAKTMYITIYFGDLQKFFAITKEMCYNITVIRSFGKNKILFYLSRHLSLVFGAIILTVVPLIADGYIFDYEFYGSGSAYYRQVQDYLVENGVKKFSRFDGIDCKELSGKILKDNSEFSFVNVYKSGNTLKVELVASEVPKEKFGGDKKQLLSDTDGVVEYVKVYRGTCLVKEGQSVKNGEILVDGFYDSNGTVIPVNVIATASIIVERKYEFTVQNDLKTDSQEEYYKAVVKDKLENYDVVYVNVKTVKNGNNNKYIVTAKYRRIISCG